VNTVIFILETEPSLWQASRRTGVYVSRGRLNVGREDVRPSSRPCWEIGGTGSTWRR